MGSTCMIIPLYKEGHATRQIDGSEFLFSCKIERYLKWLSRAFLITLIAEKVYHDSIQSEHVLRKIHDCKFRPKDSDFHRHFFDPNSPKLFISLLFPNFQKQKPFFLPSFFLFIPHKF